MKHLLFLVYYFFLVSYTEPEFVNHMHEATLARMYAGTVDYFRFCYWLAVYACLARALVLERNGGWLKEALRPFKIMIGYYVIRRLFIIIRS